MEGILPRLSEKKVGNARDSTPNGGGSGMPSELADIRQKE